MSQGRLSRIRIFERIHDFVVAGVNDELTERDWNEFESLLGESDEACQLYYQYLEDADLLQTVLDSPPMAADETASLGALPGPLGLPAGVGYGALGPFFTGWPLAYTIGAVLVGMGLLVASFVHVSRPSSVATNPRPSAVGSATSVASGGNVVVARVTGLADCRLEEGTTAVSPGAKILLGQRYVLASGMMEITYHGGAKVILQGPVTYEVDSPTGGYLVLGKLTARVVASGQWSVVSANRGAERAADSNPQSPIPNSSVAYPLFTVRTPTATVTDLGTEFGVEVDRRGAVEACVYDGRVHVTSLGKDGGIGTEATVRRGEAVRVVPGHRTILAARVDNEKYARQMPNRGLSRDDFERPRDYRTDGTAGTIWSGILNADMASRLDTLPTDGDAAAEGRLTIAVPQGAFVGWETPKRPGLSKRAPYLYVNMPEGDFEAEVQIASQSCLPFSVAGLMVRRNDDNFISINKNAFAQGLDSFDLRTETAGVDTTLWGEKCEPGKFAIRLVRLGDGFLAYSSVDGGVTWKPLSSGPNHAAVLHRPDMVGPVQVGLWYGTFNPEGGAASFDNFRVRRIR